MKTFIAGLALAASPAFALTIPSLPDAQRVFEESQTVRGYVMPTGSVQQTGRELRLDDFVEVTGLLNRVTLELPRRYSLDEAFAELAPEGSVLFECEGRACGRSNLWANSLYNRAQLYGRDRDQRYRIVREGDQTLSFYLVERGNRRIYAHFEQVISEPAVVRPGQPVVLNVQFNDQDRLIGTPDFSRLQEAAIGQADWDWRFVLELPGDSGLARLEQRAEMRAAQLTEAAQAAGLSWPVVVLAGAGASVDSGDRVTWVGFKP